MIFCIPLFPSIDIIINGLDHAQTLSILRFRDASIDTLTHLPTQKTRARACAHTYIYIYEN